MLEIIPQKFYHIAFFQKHFQILERGLRTGILIVRRHIMVYHQDNLFPHAALPGPERVRVSIVQALAGQLCLPFLFQLLIVGYLVTLKPCPLHVRPIGNPLEMDHLGKGLVYHPVAGFAHCKSQVRILAVSRRKAVVKTADLLPQLFRQ